jgi:ketosteroid isomerase-like protein
MTRLSRLLGVAFLFTGLLASCGTPAAVLPTGVPSATPAPVFLASATPTLPQATLTPSSVPVSEIEVLVKDFIAAVTAHDSEKIVSFYSQDIEAYDATETYANNFSTVSYFYRDMYKNGPFDFKMTSFFITPDGRFAVAVGTFTGPGDSSNLVTQPAVNLFQFKDSKIIWEYDYYGGGTGGPLPVQSIPASANQNVGGLDLTRTGIAHWEAAYNNRDAEIFLGMYAEQAEIIEVVNPKWKIFQKSDYEKEVNINFSRPQFASRLDHFYISANGRFAAIQGTFQDQNVPERPMVIMVEVENGKIIKQYTYWI